MLPDDLEIQIPRQKKWRLNVVYLVKFHYIVKSDCGAAGDKGEIKVQGGSFCEWRAKAILSPIIKEALHKKFKKEISFEIIIDSWEEEGDFIVGKRKIPIRKIVPKRPTYSLVKKCSTTGNYRLQLSQSNM